jgi:transformer-2 protein
MLFLCFCFVAFRLQLFQLHSSNLSQLIISPLLHFRGFGFVGMAKVEDSLRALQEMNGSELNGRTIKVERAKRAGGYEKTPGVCKLTILTLLLCYFCFFLDLGPPALASKYGPDGRRKDGRDNNNGRRGDRGGDRNRGGGDRGGYRGDRGDRYSRDFDSRGGGADYYDRGSYAQPAAYRMAPPAPHLGQYDRGMPMYRDDRYLDRGAPDMYR